VSRGLAVLFLRATIAWAVVASDPLSAQVREPDRYPIIPAPERLTARSGEFAIRPDTRILLGSSGDAELRRIADFLAVPLRRATGFELPVGEAPGEGIGRGQILLRLTGDADPRTVDRPFDWADRIPEGYHLSIEPQRILLEAASHAGLFRGIETLRQLLPPAFESAYRATNGADWYSGDVSKRPPAPPAPSRWALPAVDIEDSPRFPWRGMHLDVGRHYFPVSFIRRYIDMLAAYRMNVFHWHLTEDQGWRIQIRRYPRLTSVGSVRRETMVDRNFDPYVGDGIPYGGFYTQDEIREIVDYAASRYVTIVPEIEMPGHSVAALAAYPELGCSPGPFEVSTVWGVTDDIYCPTERTFEFLQNVLAEVMELFPGRYIHIGGDEAPKRAWEQSGYAQFLIQRENLAGENELQSWFLRRIERFLDEHGRRLIGWDEILEGGLTPGATVMSWRGMEGGIDAARRDHDVVMTPTSHVYFDYYQGDPGQEPPANGDFIPLERVYAFEPLPATIGPALAHHVVGTQGNVWTEYMKTPEYVEYMVFPRLDALAEVAWSPASARDWRSFSTRLGHDLQRLDALGVNYRIPDVAGLEMDRLTLDSIVRVELSVPLVRATIRYTLDGSAPTAVSPEYGRPLELSIDDNGTVVSARAFLPDSRTGAVRSARFTRTALRDPILRDDLVEGLAFDYVEGGFRSADEVRQATPVRSGVVSTVELAGNERAERFGLRFTGFVHVPADGIWTFSLSSDDGSRLRIGDALVVDHDGPHGTSEKSGQIALRTGWHPIEITFFQAGGGKSLGLTVTAPGSTPAPVPSAWFGHTPR
jgi:hexosaminidase